MKRLARFDALRRGSGQASTRSALRTGLVDPWILAGIALMVAAILYLPGLLVG